MRKKLILIFILASLYGYSQKETNQVLKDSTFAVGVVLEDTFVGTSIETYCTSSYEKEIFRGSKIIISDAQECKQSYSDETKKFYEIIYNNKTYFIEKEKVITEESYFSQLIQMNYEVKEKFKEYSKKVATIIYNDDLKNTINFIDKCALKGLVVTDWSFLDESEYTEGTSVKITVLNPTKKTVKYLWFTFVGYNAVDDIIVDRLKGTSKITVKGIGPIKPNESVNYEYEYVWHTDLVETAKISQIKVQYMDGTIKTILNPKEITIDKHFREILNEE
jgi:hypothetical protein